VDPASLKAVIRVELTGLHQNPLQAGEAKETSVAAYKPSGSSGENSAKAKGKDPERVTHHIS